MEISVRRKNCAIIQTLYPHFSTVNSYRHRVRKEKSNISNNWQNKHMGSIEKMDSKSGIDSWRWISIGMEDCSWDNCLEINGKRGAY